MHKAATVRKRSRKEPFFEAGSVQQMRATGKHHILPISSCDCARGIKHCCFAMSSVTSCVCVNRVVESADKRSQYLEVLPI